MRPRIYFDNCCYGRLFDEQDDLAVFLETDAIAHVQQEIRSGNVELAWSFVLDYEVANNPYEEHRKAIVPWKKLSSVTIGADATISQSGRVIEMQGIRTMDALHIACAIKARCRYFLTTDKKILNKRVRDISILNPLDFIENWRRENGR